ncbi:MAG: hypothetical protein Q9166_003237 [cf. Caloplaca sp. 2 TL-2023]
MSTLSCWSSRNAFPRYAGITRYVESNLGHPNVSPAATTSLPETYPIKPLVTNTTLGFEKVLAIGLPERSDRRDTLALTATVSDIDLEWIDAVKGSEVHTKAWPAVRRHSVIEAKYSSALIIEDDAEWDVALRNQLQVFANRSRSLSNVGRNESLWIASDTPTHNPYGDDWDLLWLGNCANPPAPSDAKTFPSEGDQIYCVFPVSGGMSCLYGYAVTLESAKTYMSWLWMWTNLRISLFRSTANISDVLRCGRN